ncbi:carbohydrate kinase [Cellulomonas sp. Sa3CUA2]|uniref:Carbohydrate kinase n=2 Tax=Cellulomonas avistercoris TaxID=2762242 RepID=A0ABR8QFD9_9CELL|nr:carbohydrate kinase [Cellulomonas avistercoris]
MPPPFLVVGESVADVISPRGGRPTTHPGGSPANVAYGLARLGEAVELLTELGDDEDGMLLRTHLERAGVGVRVGRPDPARRTPRATAVLDGTGAARYEFDIEWALDPAAPAPRCRHLHTGSLAVLLEPGASTVRQVVDEARVEATVSLDPNIRPALSGSPPEARARVERLAAVADIVKASDEDLQWLYPGDTLDAAAGRLLRCGPALVVVTRGAAGACARTAAGMVDVAAPPTRVVDTVGAGDSFMAAMLHELARRDLVGAARRCRLRELDADLVRQVLGVAARAAAVTVSRAGAALPTRDELRA